MQPPSGTTVVSMLVAEASTVATSSAAAAMTVTSRTRFMGAFYPPPEVCARCLFRPCRLRSVDAEDDPRGSLVGLRERVVTALAGGQDRPGTVGAAAQRAEGMTRGAVHAKLVHARRDGRLVHPVHTVERA